MATPEVVARTNGVRAIAMRHPHAVTATIALVLLASVVLGPWAWSAVRDKHTEGRWELRPGDHGVPAGLIIEVKDQEVAGQGPCNQFRADWSQDDGASDLLSTAIGCPEPVSHEEDIFYGLLSPETVEVEGNELRLVSDDQTLVFSRVN